MNKKISIISLLLVLFFIGLAFALTSPAVISPTSGQNVSGDLLLNATIAANNVTNVTFYFYNSTGGNLVYNTTIINDTADDTEFNYTLDTTTITDGIYNLTVNATNSTGDTTTNTSVTGVTIDNTAPSVSASIPTTSTWYNANFTVTINVTDATIGVDNTSVQYRVLNSTGTNVTNWTNLTYNGSLYTATFDITSQSDLANYTFEFNANDSLSNSNSTVNVTGVHIDVTSPVINNLSAVALSTTTGNLTVNATDATADIANCTYLTSPGSVTGTLSGSNPYNATISGLSAGTAYTVNVTCTDNAGNTQTNTTASFTTTAAAEEAAATTSSSTGGGGSATSQVAGQFSKVVWDHIDDGETAIVSVNNGEIGITEVRFEAGRKLYGMWMKVGKKDSLPSTVEKFDLKTYKYIEITKSLAFKDDDIVNPETDFKVKKSWLTDEGLSKDNVGMFRYVDDSWTELETTVEDDDSTYVYYTAETPGFSYFAIAQKEEVSALVVEEPTEEVVGEVAGETTEEASAEEITEDGAKRPIWPWVVLSLVVIIGIAAGYFLKWRNVPVKSKKR